MVTADPVATSASEPGALQPLAAYHIDKLTGFVPGYDPLARLDERYAAWEALVPDLSAAIRSRRIRSAIERLPSCDPIMLETRTERERILCIGVVRTRALADLTGRIITEAQRQVICRSG